MLNVASRAHRDIINPTLCVLAALCQLSSIWLIARMFASFCSSAVVAELLLEPPHALSDSATAAAIAPIPNHFVAVSFRGNVHAIRGAGLAWAATTADPSRARGRPLPRAGGSAAPARDETGGRGGRSVRRPRLASRRRRSPCSRRRPYRRPHAARRCRRGHPGGGAAAPHEPERRRCRAQPV